MIAPIPALHNPLASHPTSSKVSILASSALYINSPHCAPQHPLPKSLAHAAAEQDTFAYVSNFRLHVVQRQITALCPTRVHFEPQALAVRSINHLVLIAVAGYDGIYVAQCESGTVSALTVLPGTEGYPVVAVAISEHGAIVAGSMDGQVAQWKTWQAMASQSLQVPHDAVNGDRITQIGLVAQQIVVAWWSGRISVGERVVKSMERCVGDFATRGGVYFVQVEDGIVATRGDAWVYFVGKQVKRKEMQGDVIGICRWGEHVLLWIRDEGLQTLQGCDKSEWEELQEGNKGDGERAGEDERIVGKK